MTEIVISIPGVPVAKQRARRGKGGHVYTPAKTRSYEDLVAWEGKRAMRGKKPLEGPLMVTIVCTFHELTSPREHHTTRPDCDNLAKSILDGCNSVIWKDDAQIVHLTCLKHYGEEPGVIVTVRTI